MTLRRVETKLDNILTTLKSRYRREILYQLEDADTDVVQFDEMVNAQITRNPAATDREAVTAALHHFHLPQLDDIGWIEYDSRSETVRYRPETAPTALLSACRKEEFAPEP